MEDRKIISLLKKNPSAGLYEATAKYGGMAEGIIGKILYRNPEDVEECIADTFVTLWKNRDNVQLERGRLKGYIACIARNKAIDRYRKLTRENVSYIEEREFISEKNTEDEIILKSDVEVLKEAIGDMKEPDKEIFIRRFFWFEKVKEIAARLNLTEKNIENRLYRGKKRLKELLTERGIWQ